MVSINTQISCGIWMNSIGTKVPQVCWENNAQFSSLNHWEKTRWTQQIHPTIWMKQQKVEYYLKRQHHSSLLLSNFSESMPTVAWEEQNSVWSSDDEALLLQGLTCCVCSEMLLHKLGCYWSYYSLYISLNQYGHSPLIFPQRNAASWIFSLFSDYSL